MIPIHLIRQLHFCPRIVYYYLLTDIRPVFPRHVSMGEMYHQVQDRLTQHRRFKKLDIKFDEIIRFEYLEDEKLGIAGEIDLGFIGDEVIPIEYKHLKDGKPSYGHVLQLYGYGLLMRNQYGKPFRRAFIIYGNNVKFYPIKITHKIERDFMKSLNEIKEIVQKGILPFSSANESKCSQCEYLNFCDDRI